MRESEIKTVKGSKAAAIKGQGPYDKVDPVFTEIYEWLSKKGIKSQEPPFGIYYGNPEDTPEEKLLTKIQVPVKKI